LNRIGYGKCTITFDDIIAVTAIDNVTTAKTPERVIYCASRNGVGLA
jgi:hypothetical protein